MRFVDEGYGDVRRVEVGMFPRIGRFRLPDLPAEIMGGGVLHGSSDPCRDAVHGLQVGADDMYFHPVAVVQGIGGKRDGPDAFRIAGERGGGAVPAVEVSDEVEFPCSGRPFAVDPVSRGGRAVEAHAAVAEGAFLQRAVLLPKPLHFHVEELHACLNFAGVRLQPTVFQHKTGNGGVSSLPSIIRCWRFVKFILPGGASFLPPVGAEVG